MQIAEELVRNGMTSSGLFNEALEEYIFNSGATKIIETGTYLGQGTTKAVLQGLMGHGQPFQFYSIEVNPDYYRKALSNLGRIEGFTLVNGLSIPKSKLPKVVEFTDFPDFVAVDFKESVRSASYLAEVNYSVKDSCLKECLKAMDYKPDLVILDSAGHIGLQEFEELMANVKGDFVLALDDTNHVKHYKTVQKIKQDARFDVIWETSDKFGSLLAKVQIHGGGVE